MCMLDCDRAERCMDLRLETMPSCAVAWKELVGIALSDVCLGELDWRGS